MKRYDWSNLEVGDVVVPVVNRPYACTFKAFHEYKVTYIDGSWIGIMGDDGNEDGFQISVFAYYRKGNKPKSPDYMAIIRDIVSGK